MVFKLSIMGKGVAIKKYTIDFESTELGTREIWNQVRDAYRDLYKYLSDGGHKVIFHNEDDLRRKYANSSYYFNVENALEYFSGMIDLASYAINPIVSESALHMTLISHEIKAGYRLTPYRKEPEIFKEFDMAPFGIDMYVTEKRKFNFNSKDPFRYYEMAEDLSVDRIPCKRFIGRFGEHIRRIQDMLSRGLYAKDVSRCMIPVPFLTHIYLGGVLEKAEVPDINKDRIGDLGIYASMLMSIYAANAQCYNLSIDSKDEADFWSALDTYASMEQSERDEIKSYTMTSMIECMSVFLRRKANYNDIIPTFRKEVLIDLCKK